MGLRDRRTWLRILAVVGLLALVWVGIGLFADSPQEPDTHWSLYRPQASTEDLLLALSGAVNAPLRRGGRAELLVNGEEYVPALLEAIGGAKRSVHFMTYVWEPGRMSDLVFDALTERARAGVDVRLLLDGHGASAAREDRIATLREAGGQVAVFAPLRPWNVDRLDHRNHRRAIVIDGETGFTGGAAVGDAWLGDAEGPESWRDDLVRVTGPLARSLQAAFAQLWSATTGEILTGPSVYPPEPADGVVGQPVLYHLSVVSSPTSFDRPLRKVWWLTVAAARERLWIVTPYFVPDGAIEKELAESAKRGVDVRLLTAGEHVDIAVVRWAAQGHYERLLEAGVRIFEYEPTLIHAKWLVADGVWSVVGSANLDVRSEELNLENVLTILDAPFAAALERQFERDLGRTREITLDEWRDRGLLARLRERLALVLEERL